MSDPHLRLRMRIDEQARLIEKYGDRYPVSASDYLAALQATRAAWEALESAEGLADSEFGPCCETDTGHTNDCPYGRALDALEALIGDDDGE